MANLILYFFPNLGRGWAGEVVRQHLPGEPPGRLAATHRVHHFRGAHQPERHGRSVAGD